MLCCFFVLDFSLVYYNPWLMGECSPMARWTEVQTPGRVIPKTQKWYLMPPCLTLSNIRYGSRVKWRNPRKGVAPCFTPQCSSYRKGSLRVTCDYDCQLTYNALDEREKYFESQLIIRQNHSNVSQDRSNPLL